MSIEALSWALNLAPIPVDSNGKPSSACAFVLVALANHAGPDGTAAFPSVDTLMHYTRLSERTVRDSLRRLEASAVIRSCNPAVIAAFIARADRRPNGWDLDLTAVRDDFSEQQRARVDRMTRPFGGVQQAPPVDRTGGNGRSHGGQLAPSRGARVAPEPSSNREGTTAPDPALLSAEDTRALRAARQAEKGQATAPPTAAYLAAREQLKRRRTA